MIKTIEMQMYGRPERASVDFDEEEDGCVHCMFVRDHVKMSAGDVTLVHVADDVSTLRRVEAKMKLGRVILLKCEAISPDEADEQLRSIAPPFSAHHRFARA